MFTARNAIIAAALLATATIGLSALKTRRDPGSNRYAANSFGTHWNGYRALFELLEDSGVQVERHIGPPLEPLASDTTYVVLIPETAIVATEPAYLERMLKWVEAGGRIVAAPVFAPPYPSAIPDRKKNKTVTLSDALGIQGLTVAQHNPYVSNDSDSAQAQGKDRKKREQPSSDDERRRRLRQAMGQAVQDVWDPSTTNFGTVEVRTTGTFPLQPARIKHLCLPTEAERRLVLAKPKEAAGLLKTEATDENQPRILAAAFRRGQGEIIILAEPALLMNRCLAQADNAALAFDLLAGGDRRVVFDEFYHGLSIRGEPFWLLTQPRFAVGALAMVLLVGLVVWRKAIVLGPPLAALPASRRTILEYVAAMARFFREARHSRLFVLSEVRSGVLRTLGDRLGLSPNDSTSENIATALARRSPADARRFEAAMHALDAARDRGQACSEQEALRVLQGISACL